LTILVGAWIGVEVRVGVEGEVGMGIGVGVGAWIGVEVRVGVEGEIGMGVGVGVGVGAHPHDS
jgi:hypothetical protein